MEKKEGKVREAEKEWDMGEKGRRKRGRRERWRRSGIWVRKGVGRGEGERGGEGV